MVFEPTAIEGGDELGKERVAEGPVYVRGA